jgi:hypothetical protein
MKMVFICVLQQDMRIISPNMTEHWPFYAKDMIMLAQTAWQSTVARSNTKVLAEYYDVHELRIRPHCPILTCVLKTRFSSAAHMQIRYKDALLLLA